ncbi:MAG: T9SS type A sorting domain-containing protein, partial [Sphingobacteriales bacterium]
VYNSLGQLMGSGAFASAQQELTVSGYATGVYFVKVQSAEGGRILQFIKN